MVSVCEFNPLVENYPGISPHSRLTNSIPCSRFTSVNNRIAGSDLESLGLRNVNLGLQTSKVSL